MVLKVFLEKEKGSLFDDTPRGILEALLVGGTIVVALSAAPALLTVLGAIGYAIKADEKTRRKKLYSYASYLKRKKYLSVSRIPAGCMRVSLTPRGRTRALYARARRLLSTRIVRPARWDRKWRLILFDIAAHERGKRNAFRGFIKRIGAVMVQKSVWVHPFDCSEQIHLLREYFGLSDEELRLVVADDIGNDSGLRKAFRL